MTANNPTSSEIGFIKAMARELLVHRPDVKDADQAIEIAQELLSKMEDVTHFWNRTGRYAQKN